MDKNELKPTDTAKLLEWFERIKADHEKRLGESVDDYQDYTQAKFHQTFMQAIGFVAGGIKLGMFAIDEPPTIQAGEKNPLRVLAEIWDKWRENKSNTFTAELAHMSGTAMLFDMHRGHVEGNPMSYIRQNYYATALALAVHMEIDGTVGDYYVAGHSCVGLSKLESRLLVKRSVHSPNYLTYQKAEDAQRACELLQCVAGPLFFVFKKNTEEVSHD